MVTTKCVFFFFSPPVIGATYKRVPMCALRLENFHRYRGCINFRPNHYPSHADGLSRSNFSHFYFLRAARNAKKRKCFELNGLCTCFFISYFVNVIFLFAKRKRAPGEIEKKMQVVCSEWNRWNCGRGEHEFSRRIRCPSSRRP